jgi:YD repeat-containing protein
MMPVNGAKLVNLGHVDWSSVTHATLQTLSFSTTPIPGNTDASNQLTDGDIFAVLTNAGNYAKVQVLDYGYNMTIRWATYRVGPKYRVLGTGYAQPEDIAASASETTAYVTERSGNFLRVALGSANRASATVLASGLTAPHQIDLDEANGHAYVVEYSPAGRLVRINLADGAITPLVANLDHAVGLVMTADRQFAYVSEQSEKGGRIVKVTLNTGVKQVVASDLTQPFFLTWADASEGRLFVTERGTARRLSVIDLTQTPAVVSQVETGLPTNPSSSAMVAPGKLFICCDAEIDELNIEALPLSSAAPLLMGIGKVPFDRIVAGLADTTPDPTYPYQFHKLPFGGTLPLLVNHQRAFAQGARFYQVRVDSAPRLDGYTDYFWNAALGHYQARTQAAVSVGAAGAGFYPVRPPSELFLWLSPALGLQLNTVGLAHSLHVISVHFVDAAGAAIASSAPLTIMVNNQSCVATIGLPTLGGVAAAPDCGTLRYTSPASGNVVMPFTAAHPAGFATYSFSLIKGVNLLTPPSMGGEVTGAPNQVTAAVTTLLGPCIAPPGVAGFAEHVYVAAKMINGEQRQSQYDASAAIAFVLAPA